MKKNRSKWLSLFGMIFTVLFFVSCNDSDDNLVGTPKTSTMTIRMMDAPGDYDEVNVEVLDVLIKSNTSESGWISIGTSAPRIYNLLDLTGGISAILADNVIVPSGYLGQIRLVLGTNNSVVKDGVVYPLKTPSAQQSGLKLQVNTPLLPELTYDFLLDFDVNKSVVVEAGGSGNFNLSPVIRVVTNATSGSIKGTVTTTPPGIQVLAAVQVNGVEISSFTDAEGKFQLNGIPQGTYDVTLTPEATSGLVPEIVTNVEVVNGQSANIGTQLLE